MRYLIALVLAISTVFAADRSFVYPGSYSGVYNDSRHCPKYTVYKPGPIDTSIDRLSSFWRDTSLHTASDADYVNSGYDRGHMAPAEDMSISTNSMYYSFSMANAFPQTPKLNRGSWSKLELAIRDSARRYVSSKVWTGPLYRKSIGSFNGVTIPSHYFKVFCVSGKCRAWVYANDTTSQSMAANVVDVNSLYLETKINFFK